MKTFLNILLMLSAAVITVLVLLQAGRTDGLNSRAYGSGSNLSLFNAQKSRGLDLLLERLTAGAVAVFMITVFLLGTVL